MRIEPTYVTFEQAKWVKEKGFNLECETKFELNRELSQLNEYNGKMDWNGVNYSRELISRPEQWQVVEWLDKNHNIYVHVQKHTRNGLKCYSPFINNVPTKEDSFFNDFDSQQEAYSSTFDCIQQNKLI